MELTGAFVGDPDGRDESVITGIGSERSEENSRDGDGASFPDGELVLSPFVSVVGEYVARIGIEGADVFPSLTGAREVGVSVDMGALVLSPTTGAVVSTYAAVGE
jgi:hypothetical protein